MAHANPRPVTAAYDAALELLDRPDRPTALLCFSDVFAAQAIRAAEDLGLNVPADLSVVGYDDADFASTIPTCAHHGSPTGRREGPHRRRRAAGPDRRQGPRTTHRSAHRAGHPRVNRPGAPRPTGSWARTMSRDMTYRHLGRSGLLVSKEFNLKSKKRKPYPTRQTLYGDQGASPSE